MSWLNEATITTANDKLVTKLESEIAQLTRKLSETDYKVMPDYDKDNTDIIKQRQEWRDEIRNLEQEIVLLK